MVRETALIELNAPEDDDPSSEHAEANVRGHIAALITRLSALFTLYRLKSIKLLSEIDHTSRFIRVSGSPEDIDTLKWTTARYDIACVLSTS